jgi:excisionase family DNA binding protein
MNDQYLSTSEAGHRVGLSASTIRALVEEGRLPAMVYRYGQRPTIRIRVADLEAFVARWADPDACDPRAPR